MQDKMIKAVAFDVDGTLIQFTLWEQLHTLFNFREVDAEKLYFEYYQGKLAYRDWMQIVYGEYLKAPPRHKSEIDPVMADFVFMPDAERVVGELRARYPLAVVSSSLLDYVGLVGEKLGISEVHAFIALSYSETGAYNGLRFLAGGNEVDAKVTALKEWGEKLGVSPHEIAFVGDSINDIGAFKYTGRGILIGEGTEELQQAAWKRVSKISEVLEIL